MDQINPNTVFFGLKFGQGSKEKLYDNITILETFSIDNIIYCLE